MMSRKLFSFRHLHKGAKFVCNKLAMLKILDNDSETLCNVLDKVCISFGARENSEPDGELTDQNL